MNVYVKYRGCDKRKIDAQKVCDYFRLNRHTIVKSAGRADTIVIITCAFNKNTERKSISDIYTSIHRRKNTAKVIVGGCLPAINPGLLKKMGDFKTFTPRAMDVLDSIVMPSLPMEQVPDAGVTRFDSPLEKHILLRIHIIKNYLNSGTLRCLVKNTFLTRYPGSYVNAAHNLWRVLSATYEYRRASYGYKLRIGHGCLGDCSFCVSKRATGRLKSKPVDLIVEELKKGLEKGHKTFFITSEDVGAYGLDRGTDIIDLLKTLVKVEGKHRFYIQDFRVDWLIKYYSDLQKIFKENVHKIRAVCFPVESGSNRILSLMNRSYTSEEVAECFLSLRKAVPRLLIGTHIIVGFPGETNNDFQKTLDLIRRIKFDVAAVFMCSVHCGSEASYFPDQLPYGIKIKRQAQALAQLLLPFCKVSSQ